MKILFWNIQGLATKVSQIKEYIATFDIILLVETFVEEKKERLMENLLPPKYTWKWTAANRDMNRGRPWGGEVIGFRNDIVVEEFWDNKQLCISGINICMGGSRFAIMNIYCRQGVKELKSIVIEKLERFSDRKCIVMGDWNGRVGRMGLRAAEELSTEGRKSADEKVNDEGRKLMELFDNVGLSILNGNKDGDWNGAITHIDHKSESVIDYGAANESAWDDILSFRIGDQNLSDHFPLETTVRADCIIERGTLRKWKWIQTLGAGNRDDYMLKLKETRQSDEWTAITTAMRTVAPRQRINCDRQEPNWWNTECYAARIEVKNELKRARKTNLFEAYKQARRLYKTTVRKAKQDFIEAQRLELDSISDISGAWKYISKNRKTAPQHKSRPTEAEFIEYFRTLLQSDEANVPEILKQRPVYDITLSTQEFLTHVSKLKERKATGVDGVTAEMIKYADTKTLEAIKDMMEKCLGGGAMPAEWRTAQIFPLYKKGDPRTVSNYRGIAIGNAIYKLYAQIVCSRLQEFCESKDLLPDCQNGFRQKRSTIDAIYILNHCVQTNIAKGRKVYCAFVDFKAAFDTVNRRRLFEIMKKRNIPEYLIDAIREIYASTPYEIAKSSFTTNTGLKQGCPLSPLLFAIYTSDMEKVLKNWQSGGVVIKRQKIWMLAYADDVVILAHSPEELGDMLKCLERYCTARDLQISYGKSKVMCFSKGGRKSSYNWNQLEEVKSFTYLGFVFQCNGSHKAHVQEMVTRASRRLSAVWSIAERKFANNYGIRMQMFQTLVLPVLMYGCEVYGFRQYEEIERVHRKYIRWTLGLAPWTGISAIMTETRSLPIFVTTAMRALTYEARIQSSPCSMLRECHNEMLVNTNCCSSLARDRAAFAAGRGYGPAAVQAMDAYTRFQLLTQRHIDQEIQGWTLHIREGESLTLPVYLRQLGDLKLVARFRLGNVENGRRPFGDRLCRVCRGADETLAHILDCSGSNMSEWELLRGLQAGKTEMRRILKWQSDNETM